VGYDWDAPGIGVGSNWDSSGIAVGCVTFIQCTIGMDSIEPVDCLVLIVE